MVNFIPEIQYEWILILIFIRYIRGRDLLHYILDTLHALLCTLHNLPQILNGVLISIANPVLT